jgi:predicted RNA binding protein YcfA (HicA-like mRNA interferase family)
LEPISRRELIKRFRRLGFIGPVSGGRHQFMQKGSLKIRIPNPHGTTTIGEALLREILHQAGIQPGDWRNA